MERTVPTTASEEIALYLRTIYSLFKTSTGAKIRSLEEVHAATNSSLHPGARKTEPDISAFVYSLLRPRLIACRMCVRWCWGNPRPFLPSMAMRMWKNGNRFQRVPPALFFNGKDTLACYIASRSDIDDVVPVLTAYKLSGTSCTCSSSKAEKPDLEGCVTMTRKRLRNWPSCWKCRPMIWSGCASYGAAISLRIW